MRIKNNYFFYYAFIFVFMRIKVNRFTQLAYMRKGGTKFMPTEQALASAKNKVWKEIKTEMSKQVYLTKSLTIFLNVNRPTVSFAIHGETTPRDVKVRKKDLSCF